MSKQDYINEKVAKATEALGELSKAVATVREADTKHLNGLELALRNTKEQAHKDGVDAHLRYQDLSDTFNNWLNETWGLVYPDAPTSWEYPAQVFRHIRDYITETNDRADAMEAKLNRMSDRLDSCLNTLNTIKEKGEFELLIEPAWN